MPAFATHYFFARDILNNLDEELQERIKTYRSYYDLGAQGPDIFFFYKPYKGKNNISAYGTKLHHKQARGVIEEACKKIKEYDDEGALMYLLGYVSHFALDSSFHPIINKVCKDFNQHMILETELDRRVIEMKVKGKRNDPVTFRRYFLINKSKKYAAQLSLVFPEISKKYLEETVHQTESYMKWLYSPRNIKGRLIKFLSNKFVKTADFSNMIITRDVNHDYDKVIDDLMDDKYDEAVELGVKLYQNVIEHYENNKKLDKRFNRDYE